MMGRVQHTRRTLLLGVAVSLLNGPTLPAKAAPIEAPPVAPAKPNSAAPGAVPTTTPGLVALLRGDIEGRRFVGDAGFGVRLANGTIVNFFGDTLVSPTGNPAYPEAAAQIPYVMRNSATVILPSGRIRSAAQNARLLAGRPLFEVPARDQVADGLNFYWPTSATTAIDPATGKEVMLLLLAHMYDTNFNATSSREKVWSFRQISSRLATVTVAADGSLKLLSLTRTPMPAITVDGIAWGAATLVDRSYLYVFGSHKPEGKFIWGYDYYLARVPLASRATVSAWRYWTGSGWSAEGDQSAIIMPYRWGVESAISLRRDPVTRKFTFVTKEFSFLGKRILRGRAPALTGTWSLDPNPVAVLTDWDDNDMTYLAHEVPLGGGRVGTIISHGNRSLMTPSDRLGIFAVP
ncbi:MAG: DUF4185 domain-containing protein [Tetrasphaera jenkinsii]|jgi:hypothetical protein|nr:DUF4185 domain-containing protein [Tetrasphaera jenkinsii]